MNIVVSSLVKLMYKTKTYPKLYMTIDKKVASSCKMSDFRLGKTIGIAFSEQKHFIKIHQILRANIICQFFEWKLQLGNLGHFHISLGKIIIRMKFYTPNSNTIFNFLFSLCRNRVQFFRYIQNI